MPINLMSFEVAAQFVQRAGNQGSKPQGKAAGQVDGADSPFAVNTQGQDQAASTKRSSEAADVARSAKTEARDEGRPPKDDAFVAVIKQAVHHLQKALKQEPDQAGTDVDAAALEQAETALALLAQFANLLPVTVQPVGPGSQQTRDLIASVTAGGTAPLDAETLQSLLQAGDVKLQFPASDVPAPFTEMSPELKAKMQALIEQMQDVAQALNVGSDADFNLPALAVGTPVSDGPAPDAAATLPAESEAPAPLNPEAPAAVTVPVAPPTQPAPTETKPQPTAKQDAQPAPKAAPKAAPSRAANLEMLLKPMRGELHVEQTGEYALKGPRLSDVAYAPPASEPAADPLLLQSLDEQGKGLAMSLQVAESGELAEAMGIRLPEEATEPTDVAGLPAGIADAGEVETLLDSAVSAVDVAGEAGDRTANDSQQALKAAAPRAEEINGSLLTSASGPTPGGALGQVGGPQRAQQVVMQQVIDKVKEMTPGPASIRMVLQPESLGQLTIRLTSHQGQVSVRVLTENADVQKLLDGNLGHLKAALAESGVKLDNVQVVHLPPQSQQQGSEQGPRHQHNQSQPDTHRQNRQDASDDELAELERLQALAQQLNA